LLDGARAVFASRGFTAASMEAIAEAAGCTKPTLYAHFDSKKRIYQRSLEREAERLRHWLFAAYDGAAGKSLHNQVRRGMAAIFEYAEAEPDGFRLLFDTEAEGHTGVIDAMVSSITPRLAAMTRDMLIARGQTVDDRAVDTLAALLVGTGIFGVRHAYCGPDRPTPEHVLAVTVSYTESALRHLNLVMDE
jgi:AcrR family transcriptional regulator